MPLFWGSTTVKMGVDAALVVCANTGDIPTNTNRRIFMGVECRSDKFIPDGSCSV
jgi:hypothetical protein